MSPKHAEIGPQIKSRENCDMTPNFFYRLRPKILYIVFESVKITLSVDFLSKRRGKKENRQIPRGKGAQHERIFEVVVGFDVLYEIFQIHAGKKAA